MELGEWLAGLKSSVHYVFNGTLFYVFSWMAYLGLAFVVLGTSTGIKPCGSVFIK